MCCKDHLMVMNSLNFCLSVAFDFSLKSEWEPCWVFLVVVSSLSSLQIYHATSFWPVEFLLKNQQITLEFLCMLLLSLAFNTFSLVFNSCQFHYSVSWHVPPCFYPAWDFLHFLYLGDHFLSHVREISSYYLLKYFLLPEPLIMWMLMCLTLS